MGIYFAFKYKIYIGALLLEIHQLFITKFLALIVSTLLVTSTLSYLFLDKSLKKEQDIYLQNIMSIIEINIQKQEDLALYIKKINKNTDLKISLSNSSMKTDKPMYVEKKFLYKSKEIYIGICSLERVSNDFRKLWLILGAIISFVLILSYYVAKLMVYRVRHDIRELKEYLEAINRKEYETHIHIKFYKEFLEISLLLKNLVKRLNNRDNKSTKK